MTFLQRFLTSVFPRSWADDMEAESRRWMVRCSCGFERSLWDLGGIRWKAKGNSPRWYMRCAHCGQRSWHKVYHAAAGNGQAEDKTNRPAPSSPAR